jgi:prepilin-type N-terminal cleavage/methylation domain-containing protein
MRLLHDFLRRVKPHPGFTLVEIVIVVGIVGVLVALTAMTLTRSYSRSSVNSVVDEVIAEMKLQQIKAMSGDSEGSSSSQSYGVHFETDRYVLFRGDSYVVNSTANRVYELDGVVQFNSILFPGGNVIFSKVSGEVSGYTNGANSITVRQGETGDEKTLILNKYGVVTAVN